MKRMREVEADLAKDQILELRKMLERKEITEEEFRRRREPLKAIVAAGMFS